MDEYSFQQDHQEDLRKVAQGKLSPCLAIMFNAKIPAERALEIIAEGAKAANQRTHLKPRFHRLYCQELGLIGVLLEFLGKSAANRFITINIDYLNRFISQVLGEIRSFGLEILTPVYEAAGGFFGYKEKENRDKYSKVGFYIYSRFIPAYPYQSTKKIKKRIFKMDGEEFMLVHDSLENTQMRLNIRGVNHL